MNDSHSNGAVTSPATQVQDEHHTMKEFPKSGKKNLAIILASLLVVVAGIITGWMFAGSPSGSTGNAPAGITGVKTTNGEAGLEDTSGLDTEVSGVLEEGGIQGEGTHHLVRDGGPSQYVYLTSAILDLQSYVGREVTIWGQTISGKSAGWLVEVGKIKTLD